MPPKERPYLPLFHDQMQSIFKLPLLMSSCFVQCPISLCQTSTAPSIHLRNPTRLDRHLLTNTPESNWMMSWSRTREVSNVPKPAFTTSVKLSTVACRCLWDDTELKGFPIITLFFHSPLCIACWLHFGKQQHSVTILSALVSRVGAVATHQGFQETKVSLLENLKTTCTFSLLLQDSQGENYIYIESVITHLADQPS